MASLTVFFAQFKVRLFVVVFTALTALTADSLRFAVQDIHDFFVKNKSYPYLASYHGNGAASLALYRDSNDLSWLQLAAKQAQPEAVFLWSQHSANQTNQDVWLQHAIQLQYGPAALFQLQQLVDAKHWQQAKVYARQHQQLLNQLTSEYAAQYQQLSALIKQALSGVLAPEVLTSLITETLVKQKLSVSDIMATPVPAKQSCRMTIQPFVEQAHDRVLAKRFEQAFVSSPLSELAICFNPPIYQPQLASWCQADDKSRAHCSLDGLMALPEVIAALTNDQVPAFSHLVVITKQGEANVRGGIMLLDGNDTAAVFMHELTHWLGLVDEYPLSEQQALHRCQTSGIKSLGHNVLVADASLSQQQVAQFAARRVFKTNTCKLLSGQNSQQTADEPPVQAYKFVPEFTAMEYLDVPLSHEYAQLIIDNLRWHQVTPVWLTFADSNLVSDMNIKQLLLHQAARWGNSQAMVQLARPALSRQGDAGLQQLLFTAAELGDTDAQLLLGHSYVEGTWLPKDLSRSAYWYKQSAEQGDGFGLYFYAKCLELGFGCQRAKKASRQLYQKSALLGNPLATRRLASPW